MLAAGTDLCAVADLAADPSAKGLYFGAGTERFGLVLVRKAGQILAYENECPHAFTPLETFPDKFLSLDGTQIICSTHGARFTPAEGYCTQGPCKGQSLKPFPLMRNGDRLIAGGEGDSHHVMV